MIAPWEEAAACMCPESIEMLKGLGLSRTSDEDTLNARDPEVPLQSITVFSLEISTIDEENWQMP